MSAEVVCFVLYVVVLEFGEKDVVVDTVKCFC